MITRTNISERAKDGRNGMQLVYILDAINDGADIYGETVTTDLEAIAFFFKCFNEEFNNDYNRRRLPNLQERIADYLRGLPFCCSVAYTHREIKDLGKAWGVLTRDDDAKAARFINNWFSVCAFRIIQIAHKLDFNLNALN